MQELGLKVQDHGKTKTLNYLLTPYQKEHENMGEVNDIWYSSISVKVATLYFSTAGIQDGSRTALLVAGGHILESR